MECRQLNTASRRKRQKRQDAGFAGRVPAGPVVRRIRAWLAANPQATLADLGRLCGVSRRTLADLLVAPPGRTINRRTAERIVAVHPAVPASGGARPVSGVPVRRKVEALMAQGWTTVRIAAACQLNPSTLTAQNLLPTCSQSTAGKVDRLFREWRYRPGPCPRTQTFAERRGYLPWAAWAGGIDDVNATPDLHELRPAVREAWLRRRAEERIPVSARAAA